MSKQITVKYYSEFYQKQDKPEKYKPYKASEDAAGCDVFAAETKTILPNLVASISLETIWVIPSGYYGKFFFNICTFDRTFHYSGSWFDRF